ncbi:hypothetical protein NSZ01_04730 [Nocardioides szechwanensis]|uniref:Winged helix DNA-binding domain-containing protein n=1 Tax=Nocardioides szechwanensis TaxID=1005944 RepID=A0A1G9W9H6_9ACTN|nr:hypothetical protein NSZ01_04730 [Nocardioides szechwanensis]SDM80881.1 hypothetical protein SAMN05192576_0982 [Nocardioides szechwanensis]
MSLVSHDVREVHRLSRRDARRIAVRAQLLDQPRPTDLFEVVRRLTLLQVDPIKAVAPSADLVLWSRLGSSYDPQELSDAVDEHALVELEGLLRPADDLVLYRAEMQVWPGVGELRDWEEEQVEWVEANTACRLDILDRLRSDGPLLLRELPDTCVVPWKSSGWNDNKNVQRMLIFLVRSGEVAVAGGTGLRRLWDLAERVYPDDPVVPLEEAGRERNERRLRALGIARSRGQLMPGEPNLVADAGEPAVIDGVRGEWRVDPAQLGQPFRGRAALLAPLDRLIHDRGRMADLFEFDYQLEMYKPAAARHWGYYALPVLYGDRLVGKLDAKADHKDGVLRVFALHEDEPFTPAMSQAVQAEIDDLARWLQLEVDWV